MREIKFRGKNIDKWIYGGYFKNSEEDGLEHYIFDSLYGSIPVVSETVGQYTGLTDKNGVEIYEGDIVSDENGSIGFVSYDLVEACFIVEFKVDIQSFLNISEWSTVIGNIHENPEILK